MPRKSAFISLFGTLAAVLAAPRISSRSVLRTVDGPTIQDAYIVVLKEDIDRTRHLSEIAPLLNAQPGAGQIGYEYDTTLNGYSGTFSAAVLNAILSNPSVEYVVPDATANVSFTDSAIVPREVPLPVNDVLCRIGVCEQKAPTGAGGEGVDIYSLDTGVFIEHNDFGGRAIHGASFGPWSTPNDENGHGTHTSSTAAGTQYGTAPGASIIGVKVLGANGSGSYSGIIAGIDWCTRRALTTGKPSIINASLGGPRSDAVDQSVNRAIDRGVHFTAAAGNASEDAEYSSPAHVRRAVTVGAVDRSNDIAYFSNHGASLDVFALGVKVQAAWIGKPDAVRTISGTSMSAPAVSGIMAVALSKYGSKTPAKLQEELVKHARHAVHGQPEDTTDLLAVVW